MCGIVGIGGKLPRDKLHTAISRMNAAVAHRGPDDEGSWVGEKFAFSMRRLSIIDLPGGRQPIWDERSGIGIVYNGEVYNYRALRSVLEEKGIQFRTASDSEVVLKSLAVKGPAAVHEWNGMFAVGSWNSKESKLLLIRDRMGVKPLYYYWNGSILLFASEIKALLASGLFKPQLNPQAIWDYLTFRYVPGPESIWQDVWKLPPAHMLEWSPGAEPAVSQYWQTDVVSSEEGVFLDRGIRDFESLFLDAVELRMLASDVPVGVFLSGGLDSSAVAAAAVELGHKNFNTFSVGFAEGGEYSELTYARRVAEHLRSEHHEVIVDQSSFLEMLPEAIRSADEPLADLTIVPLLALSRLARERVKVVLSGEGSDEILAGYSFDQALRYYRRIKQLQTLHPWILKGLGQAVSLVSTRYGDALDRLSRIPLSDWNRAHKIHMTNFWTQAEKAQFWPTFRGVDSDRIMNDMYSAARSKHPLEQLLSVYQKSWLVEDLLMKADKMSMAASLELRVPLLDFRLVEWANSQPVGVKVGRSRRGRPATKFVLRQFARNRLPRTIIDRPKQGFPTPENGWLQQDKIKRWALEQLTGAKSRLRPVFEPSSVKHQLSLASNGDLAAAHKTWLLLVLEIWLREYDAEFVVEPNSSSPAFVPSLSAAV